MGFYGAHDLPYHWGAAREYVLFDRFFAAAPGGSVANHLFWLTGTGGGHGGRIPEEGFGSLPTIFDRLEERGISWKFYVQDFDPRLTIATDGRADRSTQAVRVPLLNFPRVVRDGSCSATSSIWTSTTTTSSAGRCRRSPTSRRQAAASTRPAVSRPARRW